MKMRKTKNIFWYLRVFVNYFRRELYRMWKGMALTLLAFALVATIVIKMAQPGEMADAYYEPPTVQFSFSIINDAEPMVGDLLRENLINIRYVEKLYDDDLDTALERLEEGEILLAMQIPDTILSAGQVGKGHKPINFWFSPLMKSDAARIITLLRQYANAINQIHSTAFGFQKVYEELTRDEEKSWQETTGHAINTVISLLEREGFIQETPEPPFNFTFHALTGIMILLSLLPGIVILVQTSRIKGTALEDRLLLSCGATVPIISRLMAGLIWWLILLGPVFISLKRILGGLSLLPAILSLFSIFLAFALSMLALGRTEIPTVTVFQLGWVILFALILTGGILYPFVLFPDWLRNLFSVSPLYYGMKVIYGSLRGAKVETSRLLLSFWPLGPALVLALFKGRRRV